MRNVAIGSEIPWPAESLGTAINLTQIEGPGTNDFYFDLSGAFWNPKTRRLWLCRNGPTGLDSKIWVVREGNGGGYYCDYQNGTRGEWTGFGDLEDITQADLTENTIYAIVEGEERIKEYDVSVYGVAVLRNNWNTSPYLPLSGSSGAEGIAFIPDANLVSGNFVDQNGNSCVSHNGMGGLMFVAHQNGGRLYVFDLNRSNSQFNFIGSYKTNYVESCALAFDRQSGYLYILHGANHNRLEVTTLASTLNGTERQLNEVITYAPPTDGASANMEGIGLVSNSDCAGDVRSFFLTIDDGGPGSLFQFRSFPCTVSADMDLDGVVDGMDVEYFVREILTGQFPDPKNGFTPGDMNMDGVVNVDDIALFVIRLLNS